MTWAMGDVTCYDAKSKIHTPNLDRLAKGGMRFTDAHSASAVCTPSRYALLTGRYAWRTGLKSGVLGGFSQPLIEKGRMTVADLFQGKGYRTACIGKWHLGMDWGGGMRGEKGYNMRNNFGGNRFHQTDSEHRHRQRIRRILRDCRISGHAPLRFHSE